MAECGALDIVEPDHRDILRDPQSGFLESANRPQSRNVVVRKQRSERDFALKQLFSKGIAQLWRGIVDVDLHCKLRPDLDLQLFCYPANRSPAVFRIRTE